MKRSLISQALSGLLIIPAAILGLAGILMLLTLFFFTGSALGLDENLDVILSVLLTTVGLFLYYKSQHSKTIHLAAFHGKIKAVKKYLTSGVDVNHKDKEERTPLLQAASGGKKEITELLIGAGAEVNSTNEIGGTPLHFAALRFLNPLHDQNGIVELKSPTRNFCKGASLVNCRIFGPPFVVVNQVKIVNSEEMENRRV